MLKQLQRAEHEPPLNPIRFEPVLKQLQREMAVRRRCARPETLPWDPRASSPQTHEWTSGMQLKLRVMAIACLVRVRHAQTGNDTGRTSALAETLPWAPSTSHATSSAGGEPLAIVRVRRRGASMAAGGGCDVVRDESWREPARPEQACAVSE